jgi:hypothetical protein
MKKLPLLSKLHLPNLISPLEIQISKTVFHPTIYMQPIGLLVEIINFTTAQDIMQLCRISEPAHLSVNPKIKI